MRMVGTPRQGQRAGDGSVFLFQMDLIHGLTLSEIRPDTVTTAYGPLAAGAFCDDCARLTGQSGQGLRIS